MISIHIMKFQTNDSGQIMSRLDSRWKDPGYVSEIIEIDAPDFERMIDNIPKDEEWDVQFIMTSNKNCL